MPKVKKKIITEGDKSVRMTKEEVRIALNNSFAISRNYLESYLTEAENQMKVDGNRKRIKRLGNRIFQSYVKELVRPLLEMVEERLILKEELVVALCAAAVMVDQVEHR